MDVRQLRYFLGITEHGSLSRAAAALHVAQPALSLHLRHLEEELGCRLLHRTSRGVVPTESGRRLAQRAQAVIEQMNGLRDEVRGLEAAPAGPAAIGIPTSLGILTVPLALAVRRIHPAIRLRIAEGMSGHMPDWVGSGQVDLAVVFGTGRPPGLVKEFLATERLCLVGPKGCRPLAGKEQIAFAAALALPLILPGSPHGVRLEVERAALSCGLSFDVSLEIDAIDHIKELVAEGAGYTILSERYAALAPLSRRLDRVPIMEPAIERTISLAYSSERPLSAAAQAVRGLMLEQLAGLSFTRLPAAAES